MTQLFYCLLHTQGTPYPNIQTFAHPCLLLHCLWQQENVTNLGKFIYIYI